MSKATAAVILTSAAEQAPWGDDAWRFSGAMQLVADGPDWLHCQWTLPGTRDDRLVATRFASMVLRDEARDRAADIAVLAFALLQVPTWVTLQDWWEDEPARRRLGPALHELAATHAGRFKLAVVQTMPEGVPASVLEALTDLGFDVVVFTS